MVRSAAAILHQIRPSLWCCYRHLLLPRHASDPSPSPHSVLGPCRLLSSIASGQEQCGKSATFNHPDKGKFRATREAWSLNFSRGSAFASGYSALTRKTLDSIMKVESVKHATPEELTTIWNEYHIGRGHISAVMGSQLFDALQQRASACPLFVIPVRRGHGYITLLVQAQMPYLLFTGLGDYRARGSDATPYLTVTHYTEFAETKGLVLVRGDVVLTSKLSDVEAKTALEVAHSFFLINSRYRIVTKFNKESHEFDFREVLKELNMSVGP